MNTSTNDTFSNDTCRVQHFIYTWPVEVAFSALYLLIFCVGLAGNALVTLAVSRAKHMRTVTNLFILNLAISDVLMCLFAVPFTPLQSFIGRWVMLRVQPFRTYCVNYAFFI